MKHSVVILVFSTLFTIQTVAQSNLRFDEFEAFGPFEVTLIKSNNQRIEIDSNGMDETDIIVENRGDRLSVRIKNKRYLDALDDSDWDTDRIRTIFVKVYYSELEEVKAQAGAVVRSAQKLKTDDLLVSASMGARIDLEVEVDELEAESSMGSEVYLTGSATDAEISASMGAFVRAGMLKCENAEARANMGAEVQVYASKFFDASASFGGIVNYSGSAPRQNTSTMFGGIVNSR